MILRLSIISEVNSASASKPTLILESTFPVRMENLSSTKKGQWSDSLHFPIEIIDSSLFLGRKMRSMMDGFFLLVG